MADSDAEERSRGVFKRILPPPPMTELVARFDAWLSRNRPAYYAQLLPGLTDQEWASFEQRLGVRLPDGFRVLYQWRNGSWEDESIQNNRYWMPSEAIISTKELMDGMIGFDFEPGWWESAWVPFLANGAGSHLCIDTVGTDRGQPGQLVEFWNRDHDRPVVSPSIEHWLHDFVTSLERDRWEEIECGFECVERRDTT
ncbi:MAG: SMI1/KNR4 family protein, partial [Planctomycetia bacterium]|nr:SMI1/KNR4 family protein [Planctomycetia bacterium]